MKTRWSLFPYLSIDHKAAQTALNRAAAKGWRLRGVYFGLLARSERTERTDLTYSVDLADPMLREEPGYLSLCADAGWREVCVARYMRVYESLPGACPSPIQTDGGVEYQRFLRTVLRRMGIGAGLITLALLYLSMQMLSAEVPHFFAALLPVFSVTFMGNLLLLTGAPFLVGLAVYLLLMVLRLRAWRTLRATGAPTPCPDGAEWRGTLTLLGALWGTLLCLTLALDLGVNFDMQLNVYLIVGLLSVPFFWLYQKSHPQRRIVWLENPVLYMVVGGMLLRLLLPFGAAVPFRVQPEPLPAALSGPPLSHELSAAWLAALERTSATVALTDPETEAEHEVRLSTRRYTCRFPRLADGIRAAELEPDMEPVPGLEHTWASASPGQWTTGEVLLLRENTLWHFIVYGNASPQTLPYLLDELLLREKEAS